MYHTYTETKISTRKQSGIFVREYHARIDLLPILATMAGMIIILAGLAYLGIL
jgi:hypothetical protein